MVFHLIHRPIRFEVLCIKVHLGDRDGCSSPFPENLFESLEIAAAAHRAPHGQRHMRPKRPGLVGKPERRERLLDGMCSSSSPGSGVTPAHTTWGA